MIESDLHAIITADERFTAIASDRLYPVKLPDNPTLPAMTYQRISTRHQYATTGPVALNRIRLQFDCWASTYTQVKQLQAALLAILEDSSLLAELSIQLDTASDGYADDAQLYRVSLDFLIFAAE